MKEAWFSFPSEADGLEISVLLVEPEGEARGTILMAHGFSEYKERYLPMMRRWADKGFACIINDHRGYGRSVRAEEDLGYTYELGAEGTLTDFRSTAKLLAERYPGKKMFLYGHSMGSLCALNYLKRYGSELSGVILSALPAHNPAAGAGVQYLKLKQRLRGGRYRDENAEKLIFKSYASAFRDENSKYAWINSDPALVEAYAADPHCAFPGTVDGYLSLLELMLGAYDRRNWDNVNNLLPVFIAVGACDPCAAGACDPCAAGEKGASAGEKYLKSLGFVRTEHQVYPGMRHEIHNEPRGTQVMDDMLNRLLLWL